MHHPTDRTTYTTAFVTPVVVQWLEREIAQWVHPMKDRSDDPSHHERTLLPRSYISLVYMHHPTDRIAYITAFVTPVVDHWLEWEIAQWVHPMKDRSNDPSHHERTLLPRGYISLVYMHHPTDRIAYNTAFVTPVVQHWLEREISPWAVKPAVRTWEWGGWACRCARRRSSDSRWGRSPGGCRPAAADCRPWGRPGNGSRGQPAPPAARPAPGQHRTLTYQGRKGRRKEGRKEGRKGFTALSHCWAWEKRKEGRKCLFNDALNTFYLSYYGKGPFRYREWKPTATTWSTLSD